MKFPAICKSYQADDQIIGNDQTVISSVQEYWAWAHSQLLDNTERGVYAEYLVARAVGDPRTRRESWGSYDVLSSEGIRIEVKTSAYLQSWGQNRLSALRFGIQKTHGYDASTNSYDAERKRQADVYVFCVLKETDPEKLDLLQAAQWDFYVIATKTIDQDLHYGDSASIALKPLLALGAVKCRYEEIHSAVLQAYQT